MSFRDWPASRIVLLSVAWVVLTVAVLAWWTLRRLRHVDSQGIAAISGGIFEPALVLFGPPLLLFLLWLALRRPAGP